MDQRIGTCGSCEARYKIPATFQGTQAKCKKCGGVVAIPPADAPAEPQPIPAKKPAPKVAKPAAKPAQPIKKTAGKVTPKATRASGDAASAPQPVRGSVRKGSKASASRGRKGSTRKRTTARSGSDEEGATTRRGRGARAKKKSSAPMIAAFVAAFIAAGGFAWWKKSSSSAEATENAELAQVGGDQASEAAAANELVDATVGSEDEAAPVDAVSGAAQDATSEADEAAPDPEEDSQEAFPDPAAAKQPDPNSVDLSEWPDLERFEGTTDEEWEQMNEWMALAIDPSAGAPGGRARTKLFEADRKAFPVILNHFKTLDFADEQDLLTGDTVQKLLQDICRGNNFDWRYTTEPKDVLFNKKVVTSWIKAWNQAKDSEIGWANLAKREKPTKKAAEDDLGDLDDF